MYGCMDKRLRDDYLVAFKDTLYSENGPTEPQQFSWFLNPEMMVVIEMYIYGLSPSVLSGSSMSDEHGQTS